MVFQKPSLRLDDLKKKYQGQSQEFLTSQL